MSDLRLKERASVNDQIKMLARVAYRLKSNPIDPIDTIANYFDFTNEQMRTFMKEYRKPEGDDPLEV